MENRELLEYVFTIENVVEIGEEISQELEIVSTIMRDNLDQMELFLQDNKHKSGSIDKSILDFITNIIKKSESKLTIFEEELESFSNYNSNDELLTVDSEFLEELNLMNELNLFVRVQIEEYIANIEGVKNIVEEITSSLNKQRTEQFLGSRMVM